MASLAERDVRVDRIIHHHTSSYIVHTELPTTFTVDFALRRIPANNSETAALWKYFAGVTRWDAAICCMRLHGANQIILKHRISSTNSTEQWTASNISNYSTQQACVSAPSSFALVPMPHHRRSAHPWRVLQLKDDTSGSISFHFIPSYPSSLVVRSPEICWNDQSLARKAVTSRDIKRTNRFMAWFSAKCIS